MPIAEPRNAAEHLRSCIGDVLTDLFFRPYTRKMWGLELEELDASVVKRLPIRFDRNDLYFPDDRHQALPRDGYTALFETLLRHPGISVELGTAYTPGMERDYAFCFNSMAIDEFFDCALGELPYRSLRFDHRTVTAWDAEPISVRNYTDNGRFTREAWWHCLPGNLVDGNRPPDRDGRGTLRLPRQRQRALLPGENRRPALPETISRLSGLGRDPAEHGVHRPLRHLPVPGHGPGDQPIACRCATLAGAP